VKAIDDLGSLRPPISLLVPESTKSLEQKAHALSPLSASDLLPVSDSATNDQARQTQPQADVPGRET
jgi:hypothetical protein